MAIHARGQESYISSISPSAIGDSVGLGFTVFGNGMNTVDMTGRLRVGDTACTSTTWLSTSSMACIAAQVHVLSDRADSVGTF